MRQVYVCRMYAGGYGRRTLYRHVNQEERV